MADKTYEGSVCARNSHACCLLPAAAQACLLRHCASLMRMAVLWVVSSSSIPHHHAPHMPAMQHTSKHLRRVTQAPHVIACTASLSMPQRSTPLTILKPQASPPPPPLAAPLPHTPEVPLLPPVASPRVLHRPIFLTRRCVGAVAHLRRRCDMWRRRRQRSRDTRAIAARVCGACACGESVVIEWCFER